LRAQVRAAMVFNGHTMAQIDEIDEDVFTDICVMYADGVLGMAGIYESMAPITTGVFNYIRDPKTSAFNADKIFPWVSEYKQNPAFEPTQQDNVNNALLAFMTAAPGFSMERIKNVG